MKRIKRFLSAILLCTLFVIVSRVSIGASSTEASLRGYSVDQWTFVQAIDVGEIEIHGTRYYSGSMWTWMAVYKHHNVSNNELYVMLLCTSEIQPNQNSYWDQYRWNNQQMKISFSSSSPNVSSVVYSPHTTEGMVDIGNTITVGMEGGSAGVSLSYSVSQTTTYTIKDIPAKALKTGNKKITIEHNFLKYQRNTNINDPACSHIVRNNLAIFKVKNYTSTNIKSYFTIEYQGFIYRKGVFNSATTSNTSSSIFEV